MKRLKAEGGLSTRRLKRGATRTISCAAHYQLQASSGGKENRVRDCLPNPPTFQLLLWL